MLDKANAGFSLNILSLYIAATLCLSQCLRLICALFNFTQCAAETTCLLFHQINALHQTLVQQTCLKERVQHLVNLLIMTIHLTCCLPLDTAEDVFKNYDLLSLNQWIQSSLTSSVSCHIWINSAWSSHKACARFQKMLSVALLWCFLDIPFVLYKRKSYRFGITRGWVNFICWINYFSRSAIMLRNLNSFHVRGRTKAAGWVLRDGLAEVTCAVFL